MPKCVWMTGEVASLPPSLALWRDSDTVSPEPSGKAVFSKTPENSVTGAQ